MSDYDDHESNDDIYLGQLDPDDNFISTSHSDFYQETEFMQLINENGKLQNGFSMLHNNIRSTQKNLNSLMDYLKALQYNFGIIGLSETWLTDNNRPL